jgi:hypothetical protein
VVVVVVVALGMLVEGLVVQAEVETQTVVLLQQTLVVEAEEAAVRVLVEMALQALLLYAIQTPSMPLYQQQVPQP